MYKKPIMKIVAIIVSAITLYFIIIWQPEIEEPEEYRVDNQSINDSNMVDNYIEEESSSNNEGDTGINKDEDSKETDLSENAYIDEDNTSSTVIVMSSNFNDIMEQLLIEEKTSVKNILNKLSVTDYERVNNMLNGVDIEKNAIDAFQLLHRRLPNEDFKQLEQILGKYIDFEVIKSNI